MITLLDERFMDRQCQEVFRGSGMISRSVTVKISKKRLQGSGRKNRWIRGKQNQKKLFIEKYIIEH